MKMGFGQHPLLVLGAVGASLLLAGCSGSSNGVSGGGSNGSAPGGGSSGYVPPSGTTDTGLLFPTYSNKKAGYSFVYPGGWRIKETGSDVRIARFGDAITAVVRPRPHPPFYKGYQKQLEAQLAKNQPKLISKIVQPASQVKFGKDTVTMAVIEQVKPTGPGNAPSDTLVTYRYLYWKAGKLLLLSLSSVRGVDNAPAWNLIASTLKWQ
jgi:hypothetical protein